MRTSSTRLGVLDSVASARRGAGDCLSALHLSGRTLRCGAAALGGALLLRMVLRAARPKAPATLAPVAIKQVNPWSGLAVQVISLLVLPLAHAYLTGDKKLPSVSMPQVKLPQLPVIDLSHLFYRWLGLEK